MRIPNALALVCMLFLAAACDEDPKRAEQKEILAYIGITMAKPMAEIAEIIENKHGARIIITQGGSEDLYQSLKTARKGDLYLPGSASYREMNLADGLLGDFVLVGYNQAAFMVAKGNPKKVLGTLDQILREDLAIVLCNSQSGSIGRESERILSASGLYEQAFKRADYLTTDSRNLNKALRNGEVDLILNWRATAFFEENRPVMEVIDLPPEQARPKKLLLNLLTFSKHPEIARDIISYTASPAGQAIFRRYGFIDAAGNSEN